MKIPPRLEMREEVVAPFVGGEGKMFDNIGVVNNICIECHDFSHQYYEKSGQTKKRGGGGKNTKKVSFNNKDNIITHLVGSWHLTKNGGRDLITRQLLETTPSNTLP